jgi:hypothetical protein
MIVGSAPPLGDWSSWMTESDRERAERHERERIADAERYEKERKEAHDRHERERRAEQERREREKDADQA